MFVRNVINKYTSIEWLSFLIIVMAGNSWWPIWGYGTFLGTLIYFMAIFILLVKFTVAKRWKQQRIIPFFLLFSCFVLLDFFRGGTHMSSVFICFSLLIAYHLSNDEAKNILELTTWYITISIVISLPLWLFHQYVQPIPSIGQFDITEMKGSMSAIMENHIFFVTYQGLEALRFYSLFDEPGVLGTISAFILWGNQYNFNDRRNVIILIGTFFTFSMAFYILTIVGFFISSKLDNRKKILYLLLVFSFIYVMFLALQENIAFQQAVIYRFTNMEDTGVDSRSTYEINQVWEHFISSNDVFLGYSKDLFIDKVGGVSSSYKNFFMRYGVIGFLILIYSYYRLSVSHSRIVLGTLLIFLLSFMQRPNLFTAQNIILYCAILGNFNALRDIDLKTTK